jgi:hypothetical protein
MANNKIMKTLPKQSFDYHSRKCVICRHPDRAAIEEEFVHWGSAWDIARIYHLGDYRAIYRHAHATGLTLRRRENLHSVLDIFLEKARGAHMSGDAILRAIRAYSCVDSLGRWVDPPTQMSYSIATAAPGTAQPAHAAHSTSHRSTVIDLDLNEEFDADEEVDLNENDHEPCADGESALENVAVPDADGESAPNTDSALETDDVLEADGESALEAETDSALEDVAGPDAYRESALKADGKSTHENVPALKTSPVAKSKPVPRSKPAPAPALANNTKRGPAHAPHAGGKSALQADDVLEADGESAPKNVASNTRREPALTMKTASAPNTAPTPPAFHPAVTTPPQMYGTLTDAGQINGGAIRMACIPLKTNDGNPFKSTVKTSFRPAHFARRNRRRK